MDSANLNSSKEVTWPRLSLESREDVKELQELYLKKSGPAAGSGQIFIKEIRLKASCHIADPQFPMYEPAGEDPQTALKGSRPVYWEGKFHEARIYELIWLKGGNIVRGPAVIESTNTSVLVLPGYKYQVDQYLNGVTVKE